MKLKCDLHLHTAEDPRHNLSYSAVELVHRAADRGYHVLSVTNHDTLTFHPAMREAAEKRAILLIPGVEATVMGKHVLLYGVEGMREDWGNLTFFDLMRLKDKGVFIGAPHPYYPGYNCLGSHLSRFAKLFDVIEYSHLYIRRVNFNRKALQFAWERGIPVMGSSDTHSLKQLDYTYTLLEAEPAMEEVFSALREGRSEVATRPARITTTSAVGLQLFSTFLSLQLFR